MSIRLPLKTVLSATNHDEVGAGSVNGGIAHAVTLPQDMDGLVVKVRACTVGGGVSATFQTTDDGGTTWFDVARSSVVSNSYENSESEWITIPVFGFGYRSSGVAPSVVAVGSVVSKGSVLGTTGKAPASTLGQKEFSGLPIMSQQARVFLRISGDLTTSSILTEVKVNSQSATA